MPKNSTNLLTTPRLRSISVTVSTRSVAVEPSGSLPVSRKPMTSGTSMVSGWPSMAASASIPPTPQPRTPSPLTMVVWESVPDERVGIGERLAVALFFEDDAREILEVDLMDDARIRRQHGEAVHRS